MGHLKTKLLRNTQTTLLKNKKKKTSDPIYHFCIKPVYFNRSLIYVYFAPVKESKYAETLMHDSSTGGIYSRKIFIVCAVVAYLTYLQYTYNITDHSEINEYVASNLLLLDTDITINKSIIKILDYKLL